MLIIKRIYRHPDPIRFSLHVLLACFIGLCGCNVREDGCLDIAAENFDLNADRACDGCCLYPSVSLSLSQKWNDENFNKDTTVTYPDMHGNLYKIRDLSYLLSSFSWIDEDQLLHTIDSTDVECENELIRYTSDLIIIDPKKFVYVLDTIKLSPAVRTLNFKIGWKEEFGCVDETNENLPAVFSNTSALWDSTTNTRAAIRLVIQLDTAIQIFDTLYMHTCQDLQIGYDYDFLAGSDTQFNITVNYAQWFQDADINDLNSFIVSVLANIPGSFTRTPE